MNKSLFTIDPSEKQRILEMHQSATRKQYLSEQVAPTTTTPTPATAPGPKDPSAFVKSVTEIKINKDEYSKLIFKSPSYPNGITFTTKATKSPDYKDPNTGKITSGSYVIMLESPAINIRFDFNCLNGAKFTQAIIKDKTVNVANPMEGNKLYTGDSILTILKQLNRELINQSNPFLVEFKQQFCS